MIICCLMSSFADGEMKWWRWGSRSPPAPPAPATAGLRWVHQGPQGPPRVHQESQPLGSNQDWERAVREAGRESSPGRTRSIAAQEPSTQQSCSSLLPWTRSLGTSEFVSSSIYPVNDCFQGHQEISQRTITSSLWGSASGFRICFDDFHRQRRHSSRSLKSTHTAHMCGGPKSWLTKFGSLDSWGTKVLRGPNNSKCS